MASPKSKDVDMEPGVGAFRRTLRATLGGGGERVGGRHFWEWMREPREGEFNLSW